MLHIIEQHNIKWRTEMKLYRFSIRENNYDTYSEYHETLNECKKVLKKELNGIDYMFKDIKSIMIDIIENDIIIDTVVIKGKEFILS
jgi:hypothetical protein